MGLGIDIRKEYIPVIPAAHYMMGGIKTDLDGQTNLKGFYACGEVACTGVHGANRLASNSLLEGLVFGYRISQFLQQNFKPNKTFNKIIEPELNEYDQKKAKLIQIRKDLKNLMMEKAGIIRKETDLNNLLKWINSQKKYIKKINFFNESLWELKNMLTVGYLISRASLIREESRGGHFRSDFSDRKENWDNKHIIFSAEEQEGEIYVLE
jgi:L-aspartate oxidase